MVGIVKLICTALAIWLVHIVGRRTLLLPGLSLQTISLTAMGTFYAVHGGNVRILVSIMLFVAGHAVGNGAVCWVIISEIFPTKVRGRAMSVAITSLWVFAYLGNQMFP